MWPGDQLRHLQADIGLDGAIRTLQEGGQHGAQPAQHQARAGQTTGSLGENLGITQIGLRAISFCQ